MLQHVRTVRSRASSINHHLAPVIRPDVRYMTRGAGKMCDGHIEQTCEWPTCEVHHDLVSGFDDFYSWSWESMYWPHGPVHFWLGGFLDCSESYDTMAGLVGSSMANIFAASSFDHRKALYWDGMWSCEGIVPEDTPPKEVFSTRGCFLKISR